MGPMLNMKKPMIAGEMKSRPMISERRCRLVSRGRRRERRHRSLLPAACVETCRGQPVADPTLTHFRIVCDLRAWDAIWKADDPMDRPYIVVIGCERLDYIIAMSSSR